MTWRPELSNMIALPFSTASSGLKCCLRCLEMFLAIFDPSYDSCGSGSHGIVKLLEEAKAHDLVSGANQHDSTAIQHCHSALPPAASYAAQDALRCFLRSFILSTTQSNRDHTAGEALVNLHRLQWPQMMPKMP